MKPETLAVHRLINILSDEDVGSQHEKIWVASAWTKEGEARWSKWHEFSVEGLIETMHTPFLQRINNRSILQSEIVLDIDRKDETDDEYEAHVQNVLHSLEKDGINFVAYPPASKSWHIHIFCKTLRLFKYRREFKEHFMRRFGADLQKGGDKCMIALENAPHWKTGRIKLPSINKNEGVNWTLPGLPRLIAVVA